MDTTDSSLPASVTTTGSSPFDQIRREDETGEYWSARELMPILGYVRWENFTESIDQARAVIVAEQGQPAARAEIADYTKITKNTRGAVRTLPDFRLSRHAAYLTAMRGDSRKPEIQAALTYFAVKTRLAEVLQMPTHAVALRGWAAELEAREAAEQRAAELTAENKVLAPKASKWEALCNSEGLIDMGAAAKAFGEFTGGLGRTKFMDMLRADEVQFLQVQNPRIPYEQHIKAKRAEVKFVRVGRMVVEQTFFTAKGMDWLADRLGIGSAALAIAS